MKVTTRIDSKWLRIVQDTPVLDYQPTQLYLSKNSKTGASINVSIARSCKPSKLCSTYCYGLESRIRLPGALRRQVENYDRFEMLETAPEHVLHREVCSVASQVLGTQNFLRFFGVGDLQPGSVRFINALANEAPELALWVSSRRLELAAKLSEAPNIFTMLSADLSSKAAYVEQARALADARAPNMFMAWVRTSEELPPPWATVVFAEHHMAHRAKFLPCPQTCPATIRGGKTHSGSCSECRYCFDATSRKVPLVDVARLLYKRSKQ